MDLHFLDARPSDEERAAVDAVLGPPSSGWKGGERSAPDAHVAFGGREAAQALRPQLLPGLHAVNDRVGWVSRGALNYIAQRLEVPPAEAYGVLTFYALFSPVARPPRVVHVCTDLACRMRDVRRADGRRRRRRRAAERRPRRLALLPVPRRLRAGAGRHGDRSGHRAHEWRSVAPATPDAVHALLEGRAAPPEPAARGVRAAAGRATALVLLRRVGRVDPSVLADYRAHGGYAALRRAIDLGPAGVIREVTDAKLLGRGGAAFPTGRKWEAVAGQPVRPHHLVCNADESEPGTFKDRVLMEGDPFAVVEAMTIAGLRHRLRARLPVPPGRVPAGPPAPRARHRGGPPARLPRRRRDGQRLGASTIELFRGAGAYICGEETAIFNSIEGFRGEPRNKPPFPVEVGLFGKPTLVNNVETLVNVLPILEQRRPGVRGHRHRELDRDQAVLRLRSRRPARRVRGALRRHAGRAARRWPGASPTGARCGPSCSAARPAGSSGPTSWTCRSPSRGPGPPGATLGSGVVMVLDDTVDLVPFLLRIAAFFRDESCGQCVPCRVGTVRQEEALHRLATNGPRPGR